MEVGVYNTDQFNKLLGVLDEDGMCPLVKHDKPISLRVTDSSSAVNYMLSDTSIIPNPPDMKRIPEFELKINMTPQVMKKFIDGKMSK